MSRENLEKEGITLLGNQKVKYPDNYAPEVLETFLNKHPDNDYFVKFNCPEFTSLCPITGQPDFATITISYVPGEKMVESKSLKLYLFSFRNHGDFHEDCVNIIMKDLIRLMDPNSLGDMGTVIDLTGCTLDNVLYEVSVQRPVIAKTGENSSVVIVGYDEYNTYLYDPATGQISPYGMNDSTALFESAGNVFLTYIENVTE